MDPSGSVAEVGPGRQEMTYPEPAKDTPPKFGLQCIRRVGQSLQIGGLARQGFARVARGGWQMTTTEDMQQTNPPTCFAGLDGFSEIEVYAAGWRGEIWAYDGEAWRQLASPTRLILNDVCAGPNHCVAAGLNGQIVVGRGDNWGIVEHDLTKQPFWSVRHFDGAFYLATAAGIYRLKDGDLSLFRGLDEGMRSSYSLSVGPSGLWSIGGGDVALFDGESWTTVGQS